MKLNVNNYWNYNMFIHNLPTPQIKIKIPTCYYIINDQWSFIQIKIIAKWDL